MPSLSGGLVEEGQTRDYYEAQEWRLLVARCGYEDAVRIKKHAALCAVTSANYTRLFAPAWRCEVLDS